MTAQNPPAEGIPQVEITNEMEQSFVDYAMSVIVSRALPDVRDGLKPVQRRIIYSMFENNITSGSAHRKCSKVVGDVMGNYHPHGDQAIYDALVRMGQDFSMRHLLIDPQGNFGTIDDPPGASRYTECRLTKLSNHLLEGIREDTVDFEDNYSGEMQQPTVLPSRFPNLLVNGSQGIAVGMATNIPPHNLTEVIDACLHVIDNPDATSEELLQFVKGPDFPTGGFIVGTGGIRDALTTGRGSVKIRAVCEVQEIRKDRTAIIATELPYQVSMERIISKIKELVDGKRLEGIAEVRNESSDRVGTRLVIELKSSAGEWTYFAKDLAYHSDKYRRGFGELIDVWGADHGGYIKRMQAGVQALSAGRAALDVKVCQLVNLLDGGQPLRMSKRAGRIVTLRDVVEEVGKDVVRFIMLTRRNDASLDFDLAKVTE